MFQAAFFGTVLCFFVVTIQLARFDNGRMKGAFGDVGNSLTFRRFSHIIFGGLGGFSKGCRKSCGILCEEFLRDELLASFLWTLSTTCRKRCLEEG